MISLDKISKELLACQELIMIVDSVSIHTHTHTHTYIYIN